jgi:hypothetical protein
MKMIKLFIFLLLFAATNVLTAQVKPTKPATTVVKFPKFKPPKLLAIVGGYKDSMSIMALAVEGMITQPLRVTDVNKVPYIISSYEFLYKKIVVSEEEENGAPTGKPFNTTTIKSALFKTTPLPKMWLDFITENPRPGEEIFFFNIIAKDSKGRLMYAPNIKLYIK